MSHPVTTLSTVIQERRRVRSIRYVIDSCELETEPPLVTSVDLSICLCFPGTMASLLATQQALVTVIRNFTATLEESTAADWT